MTLLCIELRGEGKVSAEAVSFPPQGLRAPDAPFLHVLHRAGGETMEQRIW